MNISVSELKTNPASAIDKAADIPVAIQKRNRVKAYLVGKELFETIVAYIEDYLDKAAIKKTDFSKGHSFEKVARELGV
ncbi:MAG: type II toxin-antitoxin system Phd/YefM family antitoxin [Patescibacteria group bacterium]